MCTLLDRFARPWAGGIVVKTDGRDEPAVWFTALEERCEEAATTTRLPYLVYVVVFYLARWCQKKARHSEPSLEMFEPEVLKDIAERIVRNLSDDGERVDALVGGSTEEWTRLLGILMKSTASRVPDQARYYADEALGKIAEVLLTGTPPARAAEQLKLELDGPGNEYVFSSPFPLWARRVAINLIADDHRRRRRERLRGTQGRSVGLPVMDDALLKQARDSLPVMLDAIRRLPRVQRSVMVMSLLRREVDDLVIERLCTLAPDLFGPDDHRPESDDEIAQLLGTITRNVHASRSVARVRLIEEEAVWALLLDVLLPHKSTRPARKDQINVVGETE